MSWGKGWQVGVSRAKWAQQRAREIAADILAHECGRVHETGSRRDLCPKCQAAARPKLEVVKVKHGT